LQHAPALTVFDHEDPILEPSVKRELADYFAGTLNELRLDGIEIIQNNAFLISDEMVVVFDVKEVSRHSALPQATITRHGPRTQTPH
jgi:hypothetical protein